jgi:hypothetical protein
MLRKTREALDPQMTQMNADKIKPIRLYSKF